MRSDDIRSTFLEFFRQRDHVIERSDTIVPGNDPTLLFTSAGMVQFKPYYTGEVEPPYRRAATSQKCLRAGGKANDLDEVGKTSRHLTFFEMLGNFSFGDYFKREAIAWAWEYSVEWLGLEPGRLWASVYEDDDEAHQLWQEAVGLPESRIVRLGADENFWGPAGETGACGPCSELHLDRGEALGCGEPDCGPGCERCERFLEYWNLVFPQFDQQPDGSRPPLKNRGIDTGMGLERLAMMLQDKDNVFDTDGIYPIIEATRGLSRVEYAGNPVPYRVIADHTRALSFMIADGILPSNEGRGYVERRLLRRAARYGRELGLEGPFLHKVAHTVIDLMSHHYPELSERRSQIDKVIKTEEERFESTLSRGMNVLEDVFERMERSGETTVPGADLFRLHDTYGFPLDLAGDIAEDRGFSIDREGFQQAMQRQRERARSAWAGSGEEAIQPIYRQLKESLGATEFVGYDHTEHPATIRAIVRNGEHVERLEAGEQGEIVLDVTPFYAESGGQVGDRGVLEGAEGTAHVSTTKAPLEGFPLHFAEMMSGVLSVGEHVNAEVDAEARAATANHHTATHLLQAALRDILGDHVQQAGSLVAPDRLRFDFTHFEAIPPERLRDIERQVNALIRTDTPITINYMPLEEARKAGAMALFGEKYGDTVRVVKADDHSMELCGGTHVPRTGVIGAFKILSESSISAGVRRIEAVCGERSIDVIHDREQRLAQASALLHASPEELEARVQSLLEENRRLSREVERWKQAAATGGATDFTSQIQQVDGINLLATEVPEQDPKGLRMVLDSLRDKVASGVVVVGSASEGKASLCVSVSDDLVEKIRAGDIVKELAPIVGGGGGGRADMAQAGGKNPEKLAEAIGKAPEVVGQLLKAHAQ
ncbi:MAG: alanine--tRNA ligase [Candidatus Hydrogenedentota bacterium]